MQYFKKISFKNLDIVQEKVFNLFPAHRLKEHNLFYLPNNLEIFLGIKELYDELERLNLIDHVQYFAYYIVPKYTSGPIHLDTGTYTYSLNVPISGCLNTKVNFYKTSKEPVYSETTEVNFLRYKPHDCILTDTLELDDTYIVNVKKPHNVVNNNSEPRITFLIRLKNFTDDNFNQIF